MIPGEPGWLWTSNDSAPAAATQRRMTHSSPLLSVVEGVLQFVRLRWAWA